MDNIKTIKCPRLNIAYSDHCSSSSPPPDLEVFIRFFEGIYTKTYGYKMCDEYDSERKICKINKNDCTYKSWKEL